MSRKTLLSLLIVVLAASFVAGCDNGHKTPPTPTVTIAPAPPANLEVSFSVQIGAQVANDSSNGGVDWSVTCGDVDCGSISPAHSDSLGAVTYTAPAVVPAGGPVTITATSTTDATASNSVQVTITPIGSNSSLAMDGQYAFSVVGVDASGLYSAAGSITSDGAGNITAGEEDFSNVIFSSLGDTLTGTYNINSDGRGTITLNVSDPSIGVAGVQTFSVVVTSGSHALIMEVDGSATSSGTLDLQDSTTFEAGIPDGTFVFTLLGWDLSDNFQTSFGGALNTTGNGDGTGAVTSGALDVNDAGSFESVDLSAEDLVYTAIDANGRGVISSADLGFSYTVYMVNAEVYRVVQTDDFFVTGGSIYGAAAPASDAGYDVSQVAGPFVFSDNGQGQFGSTTFVGQFTTDGAGTITGGFSDANEGDNLSGGLVTGVYGFPSDFAGNTLPRSIFVLDDNDGNSGDFVDLLVYFVDPAINVLDPNNPVVGGGSLLMDVDGTNNGAGVVVEQSPATLQGNFAVNITFDAQEDQEDLVGQGFSDGTSTITGNVDLAIVGDFATNVPAVLTFAADPDNPGRFTGTVEFSSATPLDFVFYQASDTQLVTAGTDDTFVAIGSLIHQ